MDNNASHSAHLSGPVRNKVLWSMAVSTFWSLFLWGFWSRGFAALGLNAAVFLFATSGLFLWTLKRREVKLRRELFWVVPLGLVALSYALYENPFLKNWSFVIFLAAFAFFTNYAMLADRAKHAWGDALLTRMLVRSFSFLNAFGESLELHGRLLVLNRKENGTAKRVVVGILMLLAVASIVVVPLLSAADAEFAQRVSESMAWLGKVVNMTAVGKICAAFLLTILVTAAVVAWTKPHELPDEARVRAQLDSIVAGIVIGGLLVIYALFLAIQLKRLWVGALPFDFKSVELLVKSGFWQLLVLTFLNLVVWFTAFRRTVPLVQKILLAFSVASLLLLASAGQRMGLYVTYYGLSYEKFFASYAVVYCAILMVWLITRMFVSRRVDVIKFASLLFLWMYGVATVLPVEQIVLRSNVALAQREGSQIRLYELTMLSADVLGTVRDLDSRGLLKETEEALEREQVFFLQRPQSDWSGWIESQEKRIASKRWYEYNLSNLLSR